MNKIESLTLAIHQEIKKVYIGKDKQIKAILAALLCGGHVLLDDLPGSGKTTLAKAFSKALGCDYQRIQFTSDLMPSDIIGTTIYDQQTSAFRQIQGPVFTNILLADEINRALPRTQSALLEAMEEQQITIDRSTSKLPAPFLVLATQNPVERESTFPLPAAQMDRFFIQLSLGYPTPEEELQMISQLGSGADFDQIHAVTSAQGLIAIRAQIQDILVSLPVQKYIISLVQQTRDWKDLEYGASPRASQDLLQMGKALAAMNGRDYVLPDDIQEAWIPVISHRLILSASAGYSGKTVEDVAAEILSSVPATPNHEEMIQHAAGK